MNINELLDAMDYMDETMKTEVIDTMYNTQSKHRSGRRLLRTLMIAAVITALLCTSVFAANALINSPDKAWEVAQEEINVMKEMGILSADVNMSAAPERVFPVEAEQGDAYWFGRLWKHRYTVGSSTSDYFMNMDVDTTTGKITRLHIEAYADANDIPVGTMDVFGETHNLYKNYDDLFRADITVDEFCTLLAKYWGFSGYTLSGTQDSYYGYNTQAPSGEMKMIDVPEEIYLTVYFDGDQAGVPMYIQKHMFPGRVSLLIGTNHSIG